MKDNFKLVAITVVFVLMGLILSFISLRGEDFNVAVNCVFNDSVFSVGEKIGNYQEDYFCVCEEGGLIDCVPLEAESHKILDLEEEVSVESEDLEVGGLKFEYRYLTGISQGDEKIVFDTVFTNVSVVDQDLVIVLEKMQNCENMGVVSEQEGFYEKFNNTIKLYNKVEEKSGIDCIVELKYILEDYGDSDFDDINIVFVDKAGFETHALVCAYGGSIYSNEDVFKSEEGLICECKDGEIVCD